MRVSLKWLRDYVDVSISGSELANCLTMAGNEVKAVEVIGAHWENVTIGQITAINPHPNADRLKHRHRTEDCFCVSRRGTKRRTYRPDDTLEAGQDSRGRI